MYSRLGTPCTFFLTTIKMAIVYEAIHTGVSTNFLNAFSHTTRTWLFVASSLCRIHIPKRNSSVQTTYREFKGK